MIFLYVNCNFIPVRKLATEQIAPLVKKMEDEHKIDETVRQMLFDNGVSEKCKNDSLFRLIYLCFLYKLTDTVNNPI